LQNPERGKAVEKEISKIDGEKDLQRTSIG
jgi:hypothetical protein